MHRHSGEPSLQNGTHAVPFCFAALRTGRTPAGAATMAGLPPPTVPMTCDRKILRQQLRQARRALPVAVRLAAADALAERLLALPAAPQHGLVAGYWAGDGEIALHRWQTRLPAGLTYCLPMLAGEVLRFAPWRPGQASTTNRYGIPEPDIAIADALPATAMALVVTPLVGFDATCQRLGMGGGWYDRSFAFRQAQPAPPLLVGAAHDCQQVPSLPGSPWDVRLDAVCTPTSTFLAERSP